MYTNVYVYVYKCICDKCIHVIYHLLLLMYTHLYVEDLSATELILIYMDYAFHTGSSLVINK